DEPSNQARELRARIDAIRPFADVSAVHEMWQPPQRHRLIMAELGPLGGPILNNSLAQPERPVDELRGVGCARAVLGQCLTPAIGVLTCGPCAVLARRSVLRPLAQIGSSGAQSRRSRPATDELGPWSRSNVEPSLGTEPEEAMTTVATYVDLDG